MDKIYTKIVENNKKPYIWVYSRFKSSNQNMINDILFQSLNPCQFFHFNNTASSFFKVDFSKMLKENEYVADLFEKKMEAHAFTYNGPFDDENIDEPMEEEMIDEDNIPEAEIDEADRDFIDELLAEEDNNGIDDGEGVAARDDVRQTLDAPMAWNPGRYTIRRATNAAEIVHGMRDELDRLITAELANTLTVDNTNNMTYYNQAALRGTMATEDGEGHR